MKIKEWFINRSLRKQKERARFELLKDAEYIKTFKNEMLILNETPLRKRMSVLKSKENPSEQESKELSSILEQLSESKAVKNEYQKSLQVAEDVKNYLTLL